MITMPKAKPTQIITHRIELGEWERQNIAKPVSETAQLENLMKAGGMLLTGLGITAGAYTAYKIGHSVYGWADDIYDNIRENMRRAKESRSQPITRDSFENPFDNSGYSDDGTPTNIFGLPGWGIWPGVL